MTQDEMKTFQLVLQTKGAETAKALRNREGLIVERLPTNSMRSPSRSNETLQAPSRGVHYEGFLATPLMLCTDRRSHECPAGRLRRPAAVVSAVA
jgi:hypothetical protein